MPATCRTVSVFNAFNDHSHRLLVFEHIPCIQIRENTQYTPGVEVHKLLAILEALLLNCLTLQLTDFFILLIFQFFSLVLH